MILALHQNFRQKQRIYHKFESEIKVFYILKLVDGRS